MVQLFGILGMLVIFGAIILFHEFGHFIVAKLSGMFVHEFSIGFGPALVQFKRKDTLYAIRAVPLGGYVRIAGMEPNEEDADDEEVKNGYNKKPFLAKFATILAGAFMNFVLAFIVIIIIGTSIGFPKEGKIVTISGVMINQPANRAGLLAGDKLVSIAGKPISQEEQVKPLIQKSKAPIPIVVERNGALINLQVTPIPQLVPGKDVFVRNIDQTSAGYLAGLRNGDRIVSVDWQTIMEASQATDLLKKLTGPAPMIIERDHQQQTITAIPEMASVDMHDSFLYRMFSYPGIGIAIGSTNGQWETVPPLQAVVNGGTSVVNQLVETLAQFISIVTGRITIKAMSGPVGIMQNAYTASKDTVVSHSRMGVLNALDMLALFSIAIGFFNLLPIPALDGSRLLFLTIEAIRHKPFDRNKEALVHLVGLAVLLAFVLFVTVFNDVPNLFRK